MENNADRQFAIRTHELMIDKFILQTQNLGCEPEDVVNPESSL